jgi:hypothetical protein
MKFQFFMVMLTKSSKIFLHTRASEISPDTMKRTLKQFLHDCKVAPAAADARSAENPDSV